MDMNMVQLGTTPTGGSSVPDTVLPGAGKTSSALPPPPKKEASASLPKKAPAQEQVAFDPKVSEETRLENMTKATKAMFKDIFVVSDTKFAIYKDATGQFVTRFTNLRDGSVSYIPEPDMMQYLESRGKQRKALVKIDV